IACGSFDTSTIGTYTVFGLGGGAGGVGGAGGAVPCVVLSAPEIPSPVAVVRSPPVAVWSSVIAEFFGSSTWVWVAAGGGSGATGRGSGRLTTFGGSVFGGGGGLGGSTWGGGGGLGGSGRHASNRTTVGALALTRGASCG